MAPVNASMIKGKHIQYETLSKMFIVLFDDALIRAILRGNKSMWLNFIKPIMSYKKAIKCYLAKFEDELWCYGYACMLQGFKVYDTIMHVYYKDLKFMIHAIYGHLKSHRFVFLVSGHAGKE